MARTENKTQPTKVRPAAFIAKVANGQQREDCRELTQLFRELTGKPAKMWGPSIVGFGSYHYVYPSGREGDAPLIGFAPRKNPGKGVDRRAAQALPITREFFQCGFGLF